MTIGYKIRQYRIEKGMSQEDIIRQLGISRQTLSAWENDRSLPDIISLIRLSEIFETTVDDLVQSEKTDDSTKEWISDTGFSFIRYQNRIIDGTIPQAWNPYFNILSLDDTGLTVTAYGNSMTKRYQISDPYHIAYENISFIRLLVFRRMSSSVYRKLLPSFYYTFALQVHLKRKLIISFELPPEYEMKEFFEEIHGHVPFQDPLGIFEQFPTSQQFNSRTAEKEPVAFQLWANDNFAEWSKKYGIPSLRFYSKGADHPGNRTSIAHPKEIPLTQHEKENIIGSRKTGIFLIILIIGWIVLTVSIGIRSCS